MIKVIRKILRVLLGTYIPSWDSIGTLGQSKFLSITIITPFIGWLILFNQRFVDFLTISPLILSRWSGVQDSQEVANVYTLGRLEILYFGLVFLGIAAFLFKLTCPQLIKKYNSINSYVAEEQQITTDAELSIIIWEVAEQYSDRWEGVNHDESTSLLASASYPYNLAKHFQKAVESIFQREFNSDISVMEADPQDSRRRIEIEKWMGGIYNVSDTKSHIDIDAVVEMILSDKINEKGIRDRFNSSSRGGMSDFLMLNYKSLNYSRPFIRLSISLSYIVGFALLSVPTISTFWKIARSMTNY